MFVETVEWEVEVVWYFDVAVLEELDAFGSSFETGLSSGRLAFVGDLGDLRWSCWYDL